MDSLFLTFPATSVEKHFALHVFRRLRSHQRLACSACISLRSAIVYRFLQQGLPLNAFTLVLVALLWAPPLVELLSRKHMVENWFLKHGETVLMLTGVIQTLTLCTLLNMQARMATSENSLIGLRVAVSCMPLMEIKNMCWYRLRFKHHLVLSFLTTVICCLYLENPVCSVINKDFANSLKEFAGFLDFITSGGPFRVGKGVGMNDWLVEESACNAVFTFSHIFWGFFVLVYLMWMMEREARIQFVRSCHRDLEQDMPISVKPCWEHVIVLLMTMPLAWVISLIGHKVASMRWVPI
ncbi:hypothetical protein BSKO_03941 [Bryopsis sp. KO-2023]|nr:hypothetical protein BSKO_03941 [Bryopsis sp. KO-2023]